MQEKRGKKKGYMPHAKSSRIIHNKHKKSSAEL